MYAVERLLYALQLKGKASNVMKMTINLGVYPELLGSSFQIETRVHLSAAILVASPSP